MLAPAFDVVWAYNSQGDWTNRHQMSVNGKRDGFKRADLLAVAGQFGGAERSGGRGRPLADIRTRVWRGPFFDPEDRCDTSNDVVQQVGLEPLLDVNRSPLYVSLIQRV